MYGTYELLHTNAEGRYPYNYQNVRENADTRKNGITEAVYNKQKSRRRSDRTSIISSIISAVRRNVNFREHLSAREREKAVIIRVFLVAALRLRKCIEKHLDKSRP